MAVERYHLLDQVGRGGMGTVWRAWDTETDAPCAVKVLSLADADSLLRFVREQSRRIAHPHVLAPTGWTGQDDRVLFAMPLVRGGSVATLLGDHGPLPAAYVAVLLDQLLDALGAVHEAGLVHRDVKPANLLLEPTGSGRPHLWLTDFGIAVREDEPRLTSTSAVVGTPGYLAPEAIRLADPEPTQDLYAAGVCAMEMLTAGRPQVDPRGAAEDLSCPDGVPAALWGVLRQLTAKDPARRPASADDARRLLAASGMLPEAGPEPSWARGPEPVEVLDQVPVPQRPDLAEPTGPTDPAELPRTLVESPAPAPAAPVLGRARRRPPALLVPSAAVVAVLLVVAAVLLLNRPGSPAERPPSGGTGGSSPSSSSTPSDSGTPPPGQGMRVRSGQSCTFTEVGNRADLVGGGRAECLLHQNEYIWQPVQE